MIKVGIFYDHLEYITAIWYILCPVSNLVAIWYISPRFGILNKEKSGNPATHLFCARMLQNIGLNIAFR
jgi:hypothetical protein